MGDFNARVGQNHACWKKALGRHGIGKENSNDTLLLPLSTQHQLTITNSVFQMANKYKATWMHLRSQHWYLIDYIIVGQRKLKHVKVTRAMRGADYWSYHRLLRCRV